VPVLFTRHALISITGDASSCILHLTDKGIKLFQSRLCQETINISFITFQDGNLVTFTLKERGLAPA
jgi:hypothetical protein